MRKIIYALLVLLPLCVAAGSTQAQEKPTTSNITIASTATLFKGNHNFGTVRQASVTKKFIVTNRGPSELLITAIGIREIETGFQLIGNNTCLNKPMKKLSRCQFSIKYTPTIENYGKIKTATLYVEGNLVNEKKEVKLQAKDGLRPSAAFSLYKFSNSNTNKNGIYTFNFNRGRQKLNKTLYIRNTGNTALTISNIILTDESEQWQVNTTACEKTIAIGKYCALILKFTPNPAYYNKTSNSTLVAKTNDPIRHEITANLKIINGLKSIVIKDASVCPGTCIASETGCLEAGKIIDHSEAHRCTTYGLPVCCVASQNSQAEPAPTPQQAQNNCPGNCVMSELDCYGANKTIDRTAAHSCNNAVNPVCCTTAPETPPATPPAAAQACPGECIMSETGCIEAGKTIDRTEAHRCTTYGYPVCCVTNNTPPATPPPAHAAACTETDGYLTNPQTDFNHRGTVSGYNQDGTAFSYTDSCSGNMLAEYFCANPIVKGLPVWYTFNANCSANPDHECRNGACACKPALDADGDGICNADDLCPGTAAGTWVNFAGCISI